MNEYTKEGHWGQEVMKWLAWKRKKDEEEKEREEKKSDEDEEGWIRVPVCVCLSRIKESIAK